jgi:hypothetical protein
MRQHPRGPRHGWLPHLFRLILVTLVALVVTGNAPALAQADPLPSWNDRSAKQAIVAFVQRTTDPSSPAFVPPADRTATFDQDGTLWVEHPIYTQLTYCLDRVRAVAKARPDLANAEPFRTVLSGDREAIASLSRGDLEKIAAATLSGVSVEDFQAQVKKWLATARVAMKNDWKRVFAFDQ